MGEEGAQEGVKIEIEPLSMYPAFQLTLQNILYRDDANCPGWPPTPGLK
jgi:hypothetical protein